MEESQHPTIEIEAMNQLVIATGKLDTNGRLVQNTSKLERRRIYLSA